MSPRKTYKIAEEAGKVTLKPEPEQAAAPAPEAAAPERQPDHFFDLSFRGALPDRLRALADRLQRGECTADSIRWNLTRDGLEFLAVINLHRK